MQILQPNIQNMSWTNDYRTRPTGKFQAIWNTVYLEDTGKDKGCSTKTFINN